VEEQAPFNSNTGSLGQLKRIVSAAILIAGCLILVWYVRVYGEKFEALKALRITHFFVLLVLSFLSHLIGSWVLKVFGAAYGYHISIPHAFSLFAVSAYWNYLPARVGTVVRATILKTRFNFPFHLYAVFITAPQFLSGIFYSSFGLALFAVCHQQGYEIPTPVIGFFAGLLIFSLVLVRINPKRFVKILPDKN